MIHYCLAACSPPLLIDLHDPSLGHEQRMCTTSVTVRSGGDVPVSLDVSFCSNLDVAKAALHRMRGGAPLPSLPQLLLGYFQYMLDCCEQGRNGLALAVRARPGPSPFTFSKGEWKTAAGKPLVHLPTGSTSWWPDLVAYLVAFTS